MASRVGNTTRLCPLHKQCPCPSDCPRSPGYQYPEADMVLGRALRASAEPGVFMPTPQDVIEALHAENADLRGRLDAMLAECAPARLASRLAYFEPGEDWAAGALEMARRIRAAGQPKGGDDGE